MNEEKALSLLGLCRRAGRLQFGHDPVAESMRLGKAVLVLLASDLSQNSVRRTLRLAEEMHTPVVRLAATMDSLGHAVGRRTGIVAVEDSGFANKLKTLCADI